MIVLWAAEPTAAPPPLGVVLPGLAIIALAIIAIFRRVDVRLALLLAALALGALAGNVPAILRTFLATFANEQFVVPICTAMGFAYVLRFTGCDRHLIHLLVDPLRRVRPLLVPGTVLVGFLVNIPIISQSSTAVALGSVVVPLLLAARVPAATVGATLLLGASVGGELLNPGAPELRTIVEESGKAARQAGRSSLELTSRDCVERLTPLNLIALTVATLSFWVLSSRADARRQEQAAPRSEPGAQPAPEDFRVNPVKALVPLLPLILLFLTGPPLSLIEVPRAWLVDVAKKEASPTVAAPSAAGQYDTRLIGAAMLVGVVAAALASWKSAAGIAAAFFDGAGYGFTNIISLIVIANCFGEGVKQIGLAHLLAELIRAYPALLLPAAGVLSLGFGVLSGSGMATTQSLFSFFARPALDLGVDPVLVGAVVALAAAAGRTMSPVSAVTLMCAALTGTEPLRLVKRVAVPLLLGVLAVIVAAVVMASG